MPKLIFKWNSVPKLTFGNEVHRLVPKLFRAEVTRAEHRLPHCITYSSDFNYSQNINLYHTRIYCITPASGVMISVSIWRWKSSLVRSYPSVSGSYCKTDITVWTLLGETKDYRSLLEGWPFELLNNRIQISDGRDDFSMGSESANLILRTL